MSRPHRIFWTLWLSAVVVVGTFYATGFASRLSQTESTPAAVANRIEIPELIDAGPLTNGKFHEIVIPIRNPSSQPVTLDQFKTDCSCLELTRRVDGLKRRFSSLELKPDESIEVVLSLNDNSEPGIPRSASLSLRVADEVPQSFRVWIRFTPVSEAFILPPVVGFADTVVGESGTATVSVHSKGRYDLPIGKVEIRDAEGLDVSFTPASELEKRVFLAREVGYHLIGSLKFAWRASRSQRLRQTVAVLNDGAAWLNVEVSATATERYRFIPATVVISGGTTLSKDNPRAKIRVVSSGDFDFRLSTILPPEMPFRTRISHIEGTPGFAVEVEYTGARVLAKDVVYRLDFRADDGTRDETIGIKITVTPDE